MLQKDCKKRIKLRRLYFLFAAGGRQRIEHIHQKRPHGVLLACKLGLLSLQKFFRKLAKRLGNFDRKKGLQKQTRLIRTAAG